jgi:hypothetical protein
MLFGYVIEALVALFAVFGFFCAARMLCELVFASPQIAVAIEVREKQDVQELDMLLHEARAAFLRKGRARLVVLISSDLMDGTVGDGEELSPLYDELLEEYGAECYLIDP